MTGFLQKVKKKFKMRFVISKTVIILYVIKLLRFPAKRIRTE